jgi:hypothetical protein
VVTRHSFNQSTAASNPSVNALKQRTVGWPALTLSTGTAHSALGLRNQPSAASGFSISSSCSSSLPVTEWLLRHAWIFALRRLVFMIRCFWLKVHRSPGPALGRLTQSIFQTG